MQLTGLDLGHFLRKQVCIELLGLGYSPELILSEIFHYQIFQHQANFDELILIKSEVYRTFKTIFKDEGSNFEEIIKKYSSDSDSILYRYECKKITIKNLELEKIKYSFR